jgi:hypothetical protein
MIKKILLLCVLVRTLATSAYGSKHRGRLARNCERRARP